MGIDYYGLVGWGGLVGSRGGRRPAGRRPESSHGLALL